MNDIPLSPKTQSFKEKHKGRLRVLEKMLDKELLWLKLGQMSRHRRHGGRLRNLKFLIFKGMLI